MDSAIVAIAGFLIFTLGFVVGFVNATEHMNNQITIAQCVEKASFPIEKSMIVIVDGKCLYNFSDLEK